MFVRMLKLPDAVREKYDVSSLQCVIHAAAPCPVDVKHRMIDWFGPIIHEYYGGTEGFAGTIIGPKEWLAHPGSVGKPFSPVHVVGEDGTELGVGESGELFFEGGPAFQYFKDPEKTASVSNDRGWRSLGDMGYVDDDGYMYLTDRSTFMIVSGGVNIYPQEAENLLVMHPKLVDAAVFGVPNDEFGEEVKAVVQPVDGVAAGTRPRGGAHRVLPRDPGNLQVPALDRIRSRFTARPQRQALQATDPRALLAGPRVPHHVTSTPKRTFGRKSASKSRQFVDLGGQPREKSMTPRTISPFS